MVGDASGVVVSGGVVAAGADVDVVVGPDSIVEVVEVSVAQPVTTVTARTARTRLMAAR